MSDSVAEMRAEMKQKKQTKNYEKLIEEEQYGEDFTYNININIKVSRNGKPIPVKQDILNWAGNILTGCTSSAPKS